MIDSLGSGGAQRQLVNLLNKYSSHGIRCNLIVLSDRHDFYLNKLDPNKVKCYWITQTSFVGKLLIILKILKKIRGESKNDIYLLPYLFKANLFSVLAKFCFHGKLYVFVSERSSKLAYQNNLYFLLRYIYFLLSDKIIANSKAAQSEIKTLPFINSNKVKKIWNGYSIPEISVSDKSESIDRLRLLYIARITPNKNIDKLLDAMREAEHVGFSLEAISLDIVGRVESGEEDYYSRLQNIVSSSNFLKHTVKFHGEVSNVDEYYKKCDAVVLLSDYEGLPNVICEALIAGKIIMTTNISDMQLIVTLRTGVIISDLDCDSIITGLKKLQKLKYDNSFSSSDNSFDDIRQQLSIERMFDEYNDLIHG